MSFPERISDASHSEDIIWDFEFEKNQLAVNKPLFYEGRSLNASPHNYTFYGVDALHPEIPRSKPSPHFMLVCPAGIYLLHQETTQSNRYNNLKKQIIELKNLSKGWDSYNADPPNYDALMNSLKILDVLFELQIIPKRIMPSVEGGVSFLFAENIKYADIECDNDGDIFAGMSDRTGEPILWQVSKEDEEKNLRETINKISSFLNT